MSITSTITENKLSIQISGAFDLHCFDDFHNAYPTDMSHISEVEVDLGQTTELDSSALGMLLSLWKVSGQVNGKVKILNASEDIKELLDIGQIGRFMSIQ